MGGNTRSNGASHTNGDVPDAGLRSLDHYKRALPPWRYRLRQQALPLIRWETPYLAWMQEKLRTPALDSYFAITANLGTHTFFMVFLPMCFWCGQAWFGKGLVHILALGVFWTGFIKDFYSLPRPLSPPLHRITMSGSAALEYGFPSTHSANAVSVAVYGLLILKSPENTLPASMKLFLECLSYFYAVSIVFGRLYCGMHGFLDVIIGSIIGVAIGMLEFYYGPSFDAYMHSSSWVAPVIACLVVVVLVRIHPEPADDCPCFDDSVAFAGVVIGLEFGSWTYGKIPWDPWVSNAYSGNGTVDVTPLGWGLNIVRIVFGVLIVFAWRETMKPLLLKGLPHLFRLIESCGFTLPRRFFTPASEYKSVPPGSRIDTLFPAASDFPRMVAGIRHPTTRGRSVSIGPQSAADAYETLAYRERRRRESISSNHSLKSKSSNLDIVGKSDDQAGRASASGAQKLPSADYEKVIAGNETVLTPAEEPTEQQSREVDEKEVFALLVKPRVRYDVEVVTKLIVYTACRDFVHREKVQSSASSLLGDAGPKESKNMVKRHAISDGTSMPLFIRAATEADVLRIAEISMAAFDPATDAISRNLLPNASGQDAAFSQDFRDWSIMRKSARLTAARSVMVVAVDGSEAPGSSTEEQDEGHIVGYALWFRPLEESEEEEQGPPNKKPPVAGLDQEAVATLRGIMAQEERDAFGDKGARDVWTLDSLGVDPKQQRRGIGKMLVNWGVEKAQEQQRDCYLVSTPSGLRLYESAGFETQREVLMFGIPHMSMMKWHTKS
ncbi:hypothetical protein PWT90_00377 [Aphanocladium album]|nr:hypothetical protein PWT90_00377 [Aphanocladium album]